MASYRKQVQGEGKDLHETQAYQEGGREQGILLRGPQTFKGPNEAFIFYFMSCIFILLLYLMLSQHCLHSMSKCLCRIISNGFMVSVDKPFDACKHVEATSLIN